MTQVTAMIDAIQRVIDNPGKRFVILFANRAQSVALREAMKFLNPATVYNLDDEYAEMTIDFFGAGKLNLLLLSRDLFGKVEPLLSEEYPYTVLTSYTIEEVKAKTVYVAIWEDHHSEPTAHVFSDKVQAIEWARKKCKKFDAYGEYEEALTPEMEKAGWVFNASYSSESDAIHVVRTEVDKELMESKN